MYPNFSKLNAIIKDKNISLLLIDDEEICYVYNVNEKQEKYSIILTYDLKSLFYNKISMPKVLQREHVSLVLLPKKVDLLIHYMEELNWKK